MRRFPAFLSWALLVPMLCACSTRYTPRAGPRLSVTVEGGTMTYERDGKKFPHGFAGGGLVDATEPVPEAHEAAETYHNRNVTGFILTLVGLGCAIGSVAAIAAADNDDGRIDSSEATLAGGALACALGATIAGSIVMATGQTYQFDAINLYNDAVETRPPAPGYPYPAPLPAAPMPPPPGAAPLPPPAGAAPLPPPAGTAPAAPPPAPAVSPR